MRATVKASLYNVPSSQEMTAIVPILFVSEKHTKGYLNLKRDRSGFHRTEACSCCQIYVPSHFNTDECLP